MQWIASWQERFEEAAVHVPDWHVSRPLHTLPSEQPVPFARGVCTHAPPASQVSTVHGFWSSHVRGPLTHWPLWQVATPLHALPSSHDVPLLAGVLLHTPFAAHASVVHVLPSLQSAATVQKPLPERSFARTTSAAASSENGGAPMLRSAPPVTVPLFDHVPSRGLSQRTTNWPLLAVRSTEMGRAAFT